MKAATLSQDAGAPSLSAFLLYFLRLGTLGFGGPIALAGHMQQDLVEQRRWVAPQDYKEGLALAQLAPGPLAAQLAMYLGWVRARRLGATLVALAFIGPSFLMVLILSELYVRFGGLPWMQGLFYGIGAAVIAIIARSVLKLVRLTLGRDRLLWLLFAASAVITAGTESEIIWVFLVCGLVPVLLRAWPRIPACPALAIVPFGGPLPLAPALAGTASAAALWKILAYFAGTGLFVFGSGLAIVPFLYGGVVQQFHWLTERQFIDAVAVSMITPGPVVITVAFIGYLVAGLPGATLAAIGVFLPVYAVVVLVAPHFRRVARNRQVQAFVDGVTAAATGAIAGAAVILGRRSLLDLPTISIALVTLALLVVPKKIPEPLLIAAAGLVGVAFHTAVATAAQQQRCLATPTSLTPRGYVATAAALPEAPGGPLRPIADVPLPGPANRFDYQSVDPAAGRLYLSHMNAGRVVIFDLDSSRVVGEVAGLDRATGVWAVPAHHAVYVSAAGRHEVAVIDDRTLRITARVGGIRFPDGIAYAPAEHKVFVSDEAGGADVVIDALTHTKRSSIELGGEAGNTQYDSVSHCVLVAVQTRNQLVAIDPATEGIVARYDLPGSDHPHGFTIDEPGRLAFVSCEGNAQLLVVDLRTMRVLSSLQVGADPDVLAWDPGWRRLYVASESGVVGMFQVIGSALRPLGEVRAPHAHSVAVDPRSHRVYLPLENIDGRPVLRILAPQGA